jgi:4a-hydroxytetrahydrobiopterin dehydratase
LQPLTGLTDMNFDTIENEHCQLLSGAQHRLSDADLQAFLKAFPQWHYLDGELVREFRFKDYYRSMAFVNALAFIAHAQDHHPDLSVHYNRVQVRFSTHDVGGLSRNDMICALKVNRLT